MNISTESILGICAGILTSIAMLPQVFKIIKEKKAEDVSLFMVLILISGLGLWIAYGFMKSDIPIIATNCFSVLVNLVLLGLRIKFGDK